MSAAMCSFRARAAASRFNGFWTAGAPVAFLPESWLDQAPASVTRPATAASATHHFTRDFMDFLRACTLDWISDRHARSEPVVRRHAVLVRERAAKEFRPEFRDRLQRGDSRTRKRDGGPLPLSS